MDPSLYEQFSRLQETHWWFESRKRYLDRLPAVIPSGGAVLDIGCGTGSMLGYFSSYGPVTGIDLHLPALQSARNHFAGPLVNGDCCRLPFGNETFSLVTLIEVLYHRSITQVRGAVEEAVRVLKPGGCLLVVDSAYKGCYSEHDRIAHGARRFTRPELAGLVRGAGCDIVHATYAYAALLPVVWLVRRIKALFPAAETHAAELKEAGPLLNTILVRLFALESLIAGSIGLPFGLSIQVLGRKPGLI